MVAALLALAAIQQVVVLLVIKMSAEERRRLLAAAMAKDPAEFVALERATAPKKRKEKKLPSAPRPHGL